MTPLVGRLYGRLPARVRALVPVELQADVRAGLGAYAPGDLGFEPPPPPVVPGERTGPPDFVVFGPTQSGARWWLSLVGGHPDVAPTWSPDESAHALDRFATEDVGPAAVARFHALFPRSGGRLVGHWSADGLSYPWIAPVLAEAAPAARALVLVRDPVDLLAARVAATEATRRPHVGSNLADAVDRGFAGAQVARLRELFPADAVRVLQYERCVADTAGQLAATVEFLGLPVVPGGLATRPPDAATSGAPGHLDAGTRARLADVYADDVALLASLVPDLDLARWSGPETGG